MNSSLAFILLIVLLVSATLPTTDVPSFIALARKQPGTFHFGSGGIGTSMHLAGELLKSVAGIDLVHVPFKGANQVIDLVSPPGIHRWNCSLRVRERGVRSA